MLEQCCNHTNHVAELCCAKNRRWESSGVTSPLVLNCRPCLALHDLFLFCLEVLLLVINQSFAFSPKGVHLRTKIIENKRQFEVQKLDYP